MEEYNSQKDFSSYFHLISKLDQNFLDKSIEDEDFAKKDDKKNTFIKKNKNIISNEHINYLKSHLLSEYMTKNNLKNLLHNDPENTKARIQRRIKGAFMKTNL